MVLPPLPIAEAYAYALSLLPGNWPSWATNTFGGLLCCCLILSMLSYRRSARAEATTKAAPEGFAEFQWKYICVYLVIMLADWLQGTNMWTLYDSYGVDIGTLFLTGFVSSAVFSTFVGTFVDKYGRKRGCVLYCVLEIIINLLEHTPNFKLLLAGRVMGGMSTSLLFSVFESWYITAHRQRGFPEELIQQTFSLASVGNGLVAVSAGVLAQLAADVAGEIGPFQLAIALTVLALVLILAFFDENTGGNVTTISAGFTKGFGAIRQSPAILLVAWGQTLFEGATYTFVFMWVPVMISLVGPPPSLPTGLVFSCFMLCITMGGFIFDALSDNGVSIEAITALCCAAATVAMAGCSVAPDTFRVVFACFLLLEVSVGASYAAYATLRARLIPEDQRATVTNLFRVPLNMCVVLGTKLTDSYSPRLCFPVVTVWFIIATGCQLALMKANFAGHKAKKA